jgi:hypothetical protein
MTRRFQWITRRAAALLTAGVLLQTGGCNFDLTTLASGLLTSIANTLLTTYVSGAFNLAV